ncbi:unnamed protein product, partial [Rotaria magnacalcarata]
MGEEHSQTKDSIIEIGKLRHDTIHASR